MHKLTNVVRYFVCGTVSDRDGFTYKSLSENQLPGNPPQYLDRQPDGGINKPRYAVEALHIGQNKYVLFAEYRAIRPNDRDYNRGAYISAGFLLEMASGMDDVYVCLENVSSIIGCLVGMLNDTLTFPKDFKLEDFTYPVKGVEYRDLSHRFLADLVYQACGSPHESKVSENRIELDPDDLTLKDKVASLEYYTKPESVRLIEEYEAAALRSELEAQRTIDRYKAAQEEFKTIKQKFLDYEANRINFEREYSAYVSKASELGKLLKTDSSYASEPKFANVNTRQQRQPLVMEPLKQSAGARNQGAVNPKSPKSPVHSRQQILSNGLSRKGWRGWGKRRYLFSLLAGLILGTCIIYAFVRENSSDVPYLPPQTDNSDVVESQSSKEHDALLERRQKIGGPN